MLAEGRRRAPRPPASPTSIGTRTIAATAALPAYDLLVSNFGVMFFGDPVAAFAHMRRAASPGARMAFVCWRALAENPWTGGADARGLRAPAAAPEGGTRTPPGCSPSPIRSASAEVLTAAGWAAPRLDKLDLDLDIAAGRGLEEAVLQSTQIGAVNSWLRDQPAEVVAAAIASIREALAAHVDGASVRLPGAMWLVGSAPA